MEGESTRWNVCADTPKGGVRLSRFPLVTRIGDAQVRMARAAAVELLWW